MDPTKPEAGDALAVEEEAAPPEARRFQGPMIRVFFSLCALSTGLCAAALLLSAGYLIFEGYLVPAFVVSLAGLWSALLAHNYGGWAAEGYLTRRLEATQGWLHLVTGAAMLAGGYLVVGASPWLALPIVVLLDAARDLYRSEAVQALPGLPPGD